MFFNTLKKQENEGIQLDNFFFAKEKNQEIVILHLFCGDALSVRLRAGSWKMPVLNMGINW